MSNEFRGTGNLGDNITLKTVTVAGEDRKVAEARVFFDDYKPDGQGGFKPNGGFWLNVSIWDKRGETAANLLRKGARVMVIGHLTEAIWKDKETQEEKRALQLTADDIFPSLSRIEEIKFKAKKEQQEAAPADA
jgi:single-stranded DNA-binding protein